MGLSARCFSPPLGDCSLIRPAIHVRSTIRGGTTPPVIIPYPLNVDFLTLPLDGSAHHVATVTLKRVFISHVLIKGNCLKTVENRHFVHCYFSLLTCLRKSSQLFPLRRKGLRLVPPMFAGNPTPRKVAARLGLWTFVHALCAYHKQATVPLLSGVNMDAVFDRQAAFAPVTLVHFHFSRLRFLVSSSLHPHYTLYIVQMKPPKQESPKY